MDTLWEESLGHRLKVERNLNFSTISNEEDEFGFSRKKAARDPMSHRIIEKRRRDRMNNCLADLSRLVPTNYLKKGRGRIEKTEIIEMAIKHLKHLQSHPCKDPVTCEVAKMTEQDHKRQYRLGYHECLSEAVRFLVEIEGLYAREGLCVRLVNHLQKHFDKVAGGMCYTQALGIMSSETKNLFPMDVDHSVHSSATSVDSYHLHDTSDPLLVGHAIENVNNESSHFVADVKQERDQQVSPSLITNGHHQEHTPLELDSSNCLPPPLKVTSQLREMLQNPGLPKDRTSSVSSTAVHVLQPTNISSTVHQNSLVHNTKGGEEVYKFKNNIKHRFHNDIRHHTSSPTDSHSDHISLTDDDGPPLHNGDSHRRPLLAPNEDINSTQSICPNRHNFPDFQLSVKIPEKAVADGAQHQWDCYGETGSSCGSNPSTPPVPRSNGSSSGYSTNGEMPAAGSLPNKMKPLHQHSPAVSPYSRTPDHLNRSPSPPVVLPTPTSAIPGVPIFALHPKGTFYIPLTLDANYLAPYFLGLDDLAPVLHPVSICVNFSLCHTLKVDKLSNGSVDKLNFHFRSQPYFGDRYSSSYAERHHHHNF